MASFPVVAALFLGFLCCVARVSARHDLQKYTLETLPCSRSVDIAIVGAGSAGTYSAYRFSAKNSTIELIEYSKTVGGRIRTASLPNIPDMKLELGSFRFDEDEHTAVCALVRDLKLPTTPYKTRPKKYFARGVMFTLEDIKNKSVPFDLRPDEKENLPSLAEYYLELLTGHRHDSLKKQHLMKLTLEKDGTPLYHLSTQEALQKVASSEGIQFMRATSIIDGVFAKDVTALDFFYAALGKNDSENARYRTLTEGMSSLPETLVEKFTQSSIGKHKLSLNRKLESIRLNEDGKYVLKLRKTKTSEEGLTSETKSVERVCANKVILAIPQRALTELDWAPLRTGKTREALNAVKPIKGSKVFLTFPGAWWLSDLVRKPASVIRSDTPFSWMFDLKSTNTTGDAVMVAGCADMNRAEFQESTNCVEKSIPGSAPGENRVSETLKNLLLTHLADALDTCRKNISEPTGGISQFWSSYPFGGSYTVWKKGFNYDDAREAISHPSLDDDVYIASSDFAPSVSDMHSHPEAAIRFVDELDEKFSIF